MKTLAQLIDWSDITTDCQRRPVPLSKRNGDVFLVLHHAYNLKVQDTLALSKPGGREVSMTFAMGPVVAGSQDVKNVLVVPWDTHRPYTTASDIDDKAITVEVSNLALSPPYPVAATAKQRLAEIAAAMHVELGMPLDEWHIVDHLGVYQRGWGSYPTACCGDDLRSAIRDIIAEAKRIVAAAAEEDDMTVTHKVQTDGRDRDLRTGIVYNVYTDGTSKSTAITVGGAATQRATGALTLCFTAELGATVTTRLQRYRLKDGVVEVISEMPPVEHVAGPGQTWAQHAYARGVGNGERLRFVLWTDKPAKLLFTEIESVVIS